VLLDFVLCLVFERVEDLDACALSLLGKQDSQCNGCGKEEHGSYRKGYNECLAYLWVHASFAMLWPVKQYVNSLSGFTNVDSTKSQNF
jgi:hypothetical protein